MRNKSVILVLVIISMVIIAVCITRYYGLSEPSFNAVVKASCDKAPVEKPIKGAPDVVEVCEDVAQSRNAHVDALLNEAKSMLKETHLKSTGLKVSDSVNTQTASATDLCELNVLQTRSMVAAHSSLRGRIVADPESEENKKILQEMMFKAFASTSKNAAR